MAKDVKPVKQIDVTQVVDYLNRAFEKASENLGSKNKSVRDGDPRKPGKPVGTARYEAEVEFCYLIDDIQRGPRYLLPKTIAEANDLIDRVAKYVPEEQA